jgi:hypothetical protein
MYTGQYSHVVFLNLAFSPKFRFVGLWGHFFGIWGQFEHFTDFGSFFSIFYDFFKIFDFLKFEFSEHFSDWGGGIFRNFGVFFSFWKSFFNILGLFS